MGDALEINHFVLHWDLENMQVPREASTIQVAFRIRDAIKTRIPHAIIRDFFVYADAGQLDAQRKQDLRLAGCDLIDCSSVHGKPGQVDLRIMARALKSTEGVLLITGDSDFAYTISCIRTSGRPTAVVYDSDRTATVSTALLQVADHSIGVSFVGQSTPLVDDVLSLAATSDHDVGAAAAAAAGLTGTPVGGASCGLTVAEAALLDAVRRAPEALHDGWKGGPTVGGLFAALCSEGNSGYRRAKTTLMNAEMIAIHPTQDYLKLTGAQV